MKQKTRQGVLYALIALVSIFLLSCSATPPKQPDDLCKIFKEKRHWYRAAKAAEKRWGTPMHVILAIMYQESSFNARARPPMRYFLGFIPIGRASSAYGYAQAKSPTWKDYQKETGRRGADRHDFADAADFVGWFTAKAHRLNGVSKWDTYNLYLNYHEGWGGYQRGTYRKKAWLKTVARRVESRANRYANQFKQCRVELDRGWLSRLLFG